MLPSSNFLAFTDINQILEILGKPLMKYSQKGNKNTSTTSLNVNGIEIINTLEIANMFNTFFYERR